MGSCSASVYSSNRKFTEYERGSKSFNWCPFVCIISAHSVIFAAAVTISITRHMHTQSDYEKRATAAAHAELMDVVPHTHIVSWLFCSTRCWCLWLTNEPVDVLLCIINKRTLVSPQTRIHKGPTLCSVLHH